MKVGDGNTGGEDGVVRMFSGEIRSSLSSEVLRRVCKKIFVVKYYMCTYVKLDRSHSLVHAYDNLLGDPTRRLTFHA